jgi:hypothetical protein
MAFTPDPSGCDVPDGTQDTYTLTLSITVIQPVPLSGGRCFYCTLAADGWSERTGPLQPSAGVVA